MSGHSKWATTKRQKGIADAKRANAFTKLAKNITLAAREGGGDIDMNFKLRLAVDKAKATNMPKDNIERAIKRGTGEMEGGILEEITYEGYGPGGSAILIKTVTDNKNRTVSDIKHLFSKNGGSLGGPNSVAWMFSQRGVINLENVEDKEAMELKAIDAGAEDIVSDGTNLTIYTSPNELQAVKEKLEQQGVKPDYAEIEMIANDKAEITDEEKTKLENFFEALEENDDVDDYYSNVDL